jgi:hypothetical protein
VVVGDDEPHAVKAAGAQGAQELDPEGLGFDLADVQPDHLPDAAFADGVADDHCLREDA